MSRGILAFFLDFFELAFIIIPLLAPVADKLGIDLIWFGILLGVNMQTSFMHPPFGFALFYLRSVSPAREYVDKISGKLTAPITTGQIYWGAVPFVFIQMIMVGILIAFPQLVTGNLEHSNINPENIEIKIPTPDYGMPQGDTVPDYGPQNDNPYESGTDDSGSTPDSTSPYDESQDEKSLYGDDASDQSDANNQSKDSDQIDERNDNLEELFK